MSQKNSNFTSTGSTVKRLSELVPGERIKISNHQFGATNPAIFLAHDRTNLKRDVGYASFDRGHGIEPEFAIWQHDLDSGMTTIARA